MSAIQSNLASILLPAWSKSAPQHGASCNCASCSSGSSKTSSSSAYSTGAQGSGMADNASPPAGAAGQSNAMGKPLSESQQAEVAQLKRTDSAVRQHEQAHLSAAGAYARGGIVLNFKPGPDGKQYAVGGHVNIDTSKVAGNPSATLAKMEIIQRAALAPADPSGQDRNVAAQAAQTANEARAQLTQTQSSSSATAAAAGSSGAGAAGSTGIEATSTSSSGAATPRKQVIAAKFRQVSASFSGSSGGAGAAQLLDVIG